MRARPVVLVCPYCGKQNLIAPERLRLVEERPIKCWACQRVIPKAVVEKAKKDG